MAAAFPVAYKKMAHPEGQFKSYGSCSRHIETHPSHEAMDDGILSGIKKACGNEAIGEDSRPAGLIHNLLISVGKGKEKK